ncbi:glycosyltransferase family 4 protein [Polaromonas jejuensis]|uniref:Glycosyltransferase family 4 protein n=1 Tax=Polaromonas jejuensis TaxID=457502 RepID=A0ABW0Q6P7_9BURK|nr:glycosyltransferase family 4 protein [Polaromonas jejuensis]
MKVLFLAQLPPPVHGASLASKYALEALTEEGHFSVVSFNISLADELASLGMPSVKKLFGFCRLFNSIMISLIRHRFCAVYITLSPHGGAFYKDSIILLLAKAFVSRRIIHLHGKGINDIVSKSKCKQALYSFIFRNCEVVHLSSVLTEDISKIYPAIPHIINNGVPDIQAPSAEKRYDFIFLSNLFESKGVLVFVDAIGMIAKTFPGVRCAIVGSGTEDILRRIDEKLIACNSENNVDILGALYGGDKCEVLNSSRVFVLPTFNECFPLSILEAMSAGLPVISTPEGAIPEIVEHMQTGILVDRKSAKSLADAMSLLLGDPDLIVEMGKLARNRYLHKYTLDVYKKAIVSVFPRLMLSDL